MLEGEVNHTALLNVIFGRTFFNGPPKPSYCVQSRWCLVVNRVLGGMILDMVSTVQDFFLLLERSPVIPIGARILSRIRSWTSLQYADGPVRHGVTVVQSGQGLDPIMSQISDT